MKNTIQLASLLLSMLLLSSTHSMVAQNTSMPYFCGFEEVSDTIGWRFKKHRKVETNWYIGDAARRIGRDGLYVSADEGATASYKETGSGYYIVAYKKFTLAPGSYDLTFDCRVGGEGGGKDAMRVAWMTTATTPTASSIGSIFPAYSTTNAFKSSDGIEVFANLRWKTHEGKITTTATSPDYYLAFVWKTNGGSSLVNPGACIDNIQISPIISDTECHAKPQNITATKNATGLEVSWLGNATSYELLYFNTSLINNTSFTLVSNLKTTTYSIPYTSVQEGVYSFRVRSICGVDTSLWVGLPDILYYDPTDHCLDYLDFEAPGVNTTVGTFGNPFKTNALIDHGYYSKKSVHTVHYLADEYDVYTGYQLKTVPEGSVASVRLSNWTEDPATSGSIIYTYTITPDVGVLLLNYAAVLQYADHHPPPDQTRITIDILDAESDQVLSECTYAEFNSGQVASGNYGYWKAYNPPTGLLEYYCPILWSNWRTIGINVADYVGKTVKIRVALRACVANYHFAYAYFTLDCNDGKIKGIACEEKPDTFEVTEGFNYRWYKVGQPLPILGRDRKFGIDNDDTCTYSVDMINTEDSTCYFTMSASALPQFPVAKTIPTLTVDDCQNEVSFTNESHVVTSWEGIEKITDAKCKQYEWDFGEYGTSFDVVPPPIIVPNHGDTFDISLRAIMEGGCDSIITYTIEVPGFKDRSSYFQQEICEGTVYEQNGKEYTEAGIYTDTIKTPTGIGCDSIIYIKLELLIPDTLISQDTICSDQTIEFFEQQITTSDVYTHTELSVLGCDSIFHEKTVFVYDVLDIDFSADSFVICADEIAYPMPYILNKGITTAYQITYDDKALSAGFVNSEILDINEGDTAKILLPQSSNYVKPDNYEATVTFFNDDCGDLEFPVKFAVHYPSYVLAQRWNDVIALKNADYNGGYEFTSYQWYKDGEAIPDKTTSILYLPETMDFTAEYYLLITRADDAVAMFTCPIVPTKHDDTNIPIGSVTFTEEIIKVSSSSHGVANLYSSSGLLIKTAILIEGNNSIEMPQECGVYILNIVYEDGSSENTKIIVSAK